jgi:hypothetical protein
VKNNFSTVIIAIVLISIAPMIIQGLASKFQKEKVENH